LSAFSDFYSFKGFLWWFKTERNPLFILFYAVCAFFTAPSYDQMFSLGGYAENIDIGYSGYAVSSCICNGYPYIGTLYCAKAEVSEAVGVIGE